MLGWRTSLLTFPLLLSLSLLLLLPLLLCAECTGSPNITNGVGFTDCSGLADGTTCSAECEGPDYGADNGVTPTAECKDTGNWAVSGSCLRSECWFVQWLQAPCFVLSDSPASMLWLL
jgi:hypothetical protein